MGSSLSSNGLSVQFDDTTFAPLTERTALLSEPERVREDYAHAGYVFIRDYVPRAAIDRVRSRYFELLSQHRGALPPHGVEGHPAHTLVREALFEEFVQLPALRSLGELLLGGRVTMLKRSIVRHFTKGSKAGSRAHRDQDYFMGPSEQLVTLWIPLLDTPLAGGGLVLLEDSKDIDVDQLRREAASTRDRLHDARPISPNLEFVAKSTRRRWLFADYRVGDIVALSSRLVHASLDCEQGQMRLSIDLRFVREASWIDPRWMQPWAGDDGA